MDEMTLEQLEDKALSELAAMVVVEQQRRAIAGGDLGALVEAGFEQGFNQRGEAKDPWLEGGLLVCPGYRKDSGGLAHRCTFVSVGGTWVWDHEAVVEDSIRQTTARTHEMKSVTIVAAYEGLEFDVVESRVRMGPHEMARARSYKITGGDVMLVKSRVPKVSGSHR